MVAAQSRLPSMLLGFRIAALSRLPSKVLGFDIGFWVQSHSLWPLRSVVTLHHLVQYGHLMTVCTPRPYSCQALPHDDAQAVDVTLLTHTILPAEAFGGHVGYSACLNMLQE